MDGRPRSVSRRGYAALTQISDNALLGVLWLVACLPVVTVVPATAALFAGVRDGADMQGDGRVATFLRNLRALLGPGLILEMVYATLVFGMAVNTYTYPLLPPGVALVFRTITLGVLLALVATAPYVLSLLTSYAMPLTRVGGTAILLAVGRPLHTVACLFVMATAVTLTFLAPPLVIVAIPFAARSVHRITRSALAAAAPRKEESRA